jgi:CheY-like chemotaxis protein
VFGTFRAEARDKGLDLRISISADTPDMLTGGKSRLRQILFNLVGNAVKFTDQGSVTISAHSLGRNDKTGKTRLLFTVEDTGIGVPDEMLELIFEPFTQVDGSYVRRHQGSGLGLGIVKRLVGLLGGSLCMDSMTGRGTSLNVALDFDDATDAARTARRDSGAAGSSRTDLRLLVVEYNRVNRLMVARMLTMLGHEVQTAGNGDEAMKLLESHPFDGVFMDIQMPGMNGMQATRLIRDGKDGTAFDPAIPIIAITAHAMAGDREVFLEGGMDDYIAKPVELTELEAVLARLFPGA